MIINIVTKLEVKKSLLHCQILNLINLNLLLALVSGTKQYRLWLRDLIDVSSHEPWTISTSESLKCIFSKNFSRYYCHCNYMCHWTDYIFLGNDKSKSISKINPIRINQSESSARFKRRKNRKNKFKIDEDTKISESG